MPCCFVTAKHNDHFVIKSEVEWLALLLYSKEVMGSNTSRPTLSLSVRSLDVSLWLPPIAQTFMYR